jgi:hypothetical protein
MTVLPSINLATFSSARACASTCALLVSAAMISLARSFPLLFVYQNMQKMINK